MKYRNYQLVFVILLALLVFAPFFVGAQSIEIRIDTVKSKISLESDMPLIQLESYGLSQEVITLLNENKNETLCEDHLCEFVDSILSFGFTEVLIAEGQYEGEIRLRPGRHFRRTFTPKIRSNRIP